jgi:hypothetical protein
MTDLDLFDDLRSLSTEAREPGAWCVVRWHEGKCCGPVSHLVDPRYMHTGGVSMGFPDRGHIGRIARFDSEEEAARCANVSAGGLRTAFDVPTRLTDLRFSVYVYKHYDGSKLTLRDGVDYEEAQLICDAAKGRASGEYEHSYRIWIDCVFIGTPPPMQLAEPTKELTP